MAPNHRRGSLSADEITLFVGVRGAPVADHEWWRPGAGGVGIGDRVNGERIGNERRKITPGMGGFIRPGRRIV